MRMNKPKQTEATKQPRDIKRGKKGEEGTKLRLITLVVVMCLTCASFTPSFLGWLVIYDGCMWTFGMVRITTNKTWHYHNSREEIKPVN